MSKSQVSANWSHEALAQDLVSHLKAQGNLIWADMQLGPAGSPRPDVYLLRKSFAHPHPIAYECKISRSDFQADVTSGKWTSYLKYAYGVVFAVPKDLVKKTEIPELCGLIIRHENCWRMAKRPTINPIQLPQEAMIKLLIDGIEREGPMIRARSWHQGRDEFFKKYGSTAARYVADAASIERELEHHRERIVQMHERAKKEAEEIKQNALKESPQIWNDILEVLELDGGSDKWDVQSAIRDLKKLKEESVRGEMSNLLNRMQRLIDQFKDYK